MKKISNTLAIICSHPMQLHSHVLSVRNVFGVLQKPLKNTCLGHTFHTKTGTWHFTQPHVHHKLVAVWSGVLYREVSIKMCLTSPVTSVDVCLCVRWRRGVIGFSALSGHTMVWDWQNWHLICCIQMRNLSSHKHTNTHTLSHTPSCRFQMSECYKQNC